MKSKLAIISLNFFLFASLSAQDIYPLLEMHIKKQQYVLAYHQAKQLRAKNEGDPRFDYLYGLSALQTGHFNEAVFALDRVTVTTPRVIRPRLELARAYLKLNNKSAAIKEFNDVLELSPPPTVRQKVNTYMAELKNGDQKVQQSITKQLASFSIGYDDNINFATDNSEIELSGFGQFKLDPSAIRQKSAYSEVKYQIRHRKNNNKKSNTFYVANIAQRKFFKDNNFDYIDLDVRMGTTFNQNNNQYQFIARDRPILLNGKLHSNTLGFDAIARKGLKSGKVVSASLSLESYKRKENSLSNRKRVLFGAKLDHTIGEIQHEFSFFLGKEFPDNTNGKQFSRDARGLGYKMAYDWNAKNKSFLDLSYRNQKHHAAYPVFPDTRNDERYAIKVAHEWLVNDQTAILFSLSHVENMSNLDLYDAKRNEFKVGIRYEWD